MLKHLLSEPKTEWGYLRLFLVVMLTSWIVLLIFGFLSAWVFL